MTAERLAKALEALLPHAEPFRSKPIGAPHSPARAEQDLHIAAHDEARAALAEYRKENGMTDHNDLVERLNDVKRRIAHMCSHRHGPRMSIPADPQQDDDLVICASVDAAIAWIEALTREVEQLTRERDNWVETARLHCKNEVYYRSLCEEIGKLFGWDACRSDDGSLQQDIICLKVPEMVRKLFQAHDAAEARLAALDWSKP